MAASNCPSNTNIYTVVHFFYSVSNFRCRSRGWIWIKLTCSSLSSRLIWNARLLRREFLLLMILNTDLSVTISHVIPPVREFPISQEWPECSPVTKYIWGRGAARPVAAPGRGLSGQMISRGGAAGGKGRLNNLLQLFSERWWSKQIQSMGMTDCEGKSLHGFDLIFFNQFIWTVRSFSPSTYSGFCLLFNNVFVVNICDWCIVLAWLCQRSSKTDLEKPISELSRTCQCCGQPSTSRLAEEPMKAIWLMPNRQFWCQWNYSLDSRY